MIFEDNSFKITASNLLYIPANTEYTRQSYGNEEIIAIHFNILNRENFTPCLINVEEEKCNKAFKEIYRVWSERKAGYKYKCTAILCEYLSTVIIEKSNSKEYDKLKKSINYIERNLTQNLSVDKLAKMCNLCETQYRKIFKKEFGVSPVKYINKLRINNAVSMLSGGYYSMSEISELCGFSDQKYFNKIFRSETGKTPSQYKKEYFYANERS
jgi:AraC-like DNA-binding protein